MTGTGTAGTAAAKGSPSVAARPLIAVIRFYQRWISPALPPSCRFYPSCSAYAAEALAVHGLVRGIGLATLRLLKCGPWHPGGVDPVPPPRKRVRTDVTDQHNGVEHPAAEE